MSQRTLIIGGTSGIGFAVANLLTQRSDKVILAGRNVDKLQAAQQRLAAEAEIHVLDIANEAQLAELAGTLGKVDNIIVTSASFAQGGALSTLSLSAAKEAFDTKFWGSLAVAKYLSPCLNPRGTLTFTTGFLARRPIAGTMVKTTMNAALESAVKILAKELSPIRVNAVSPGLTDTESHAHLDAQARQRMLDNAAASLPVKTWGKPEDIARGYLFIIDNPFVTGTMIDIEGGGLVS